MQQRRSAHVTIDVQQPQDALALRRAAAVQRCVDEFQTEVAGGGAAQRVGSVAGLAAQVDQRPKPVAAGEEGETCGRRVIAAVEPAGRDRGEVAPDQAEHGVVDEQRIDPGKGAAFGGAQVAIEDAVHRVRGLRTGGRIRPCDGVACNRPVRRVRRTAAVPRGRSRSIPSQEAQDETMSHQSGRPRAPSGRRGTGPVGWLVDHPQDRAGAVGERLDDLRGGRAETEPALRQAAIAPGSARRGRGTGWETWRCRWFGWRRGWMWELVMIPSTVSQLKPPTADLAWFSSRDGGLAPGANPSRHGW